MPGSLARRTVGHSFIINPGTSLKEIEELLTPFIENFEAQSGTGEDGPQTEGSVARIINITEAPKPEAIPFSSQPENVQWAKDTKNAQKASKRTSSSIQAQTLEAIHSLANSIQQQNAAMLEAIQYRPAPTPLTSLDWTPIIQGAISGIASHFGMTMSPFTPPSTAKGPGEVPEGT